jgi:hypothetical protein
MTESQNIVGLIAPPTSIVFFGTFPMSNTKVMEITKDGIWVNPDVSVDETAKAVLNALEGYIKNLVETAKDLHEPYDPIENNADYERGFIDGRADQMKSSVDKAVNRMAQREWVGLTDEERLEVASRKWWHWEDAFDIGGFARAIEQALKEKNHGNP